MKLTGVVRREDLGPGVFVLEANGARYFLAGGDKALRKDGQKVEVDGEVDADAHNAAVGGPTFRVKSWRAV